MTRATRFAAADAFDCESATRSIARTRERLRSAAAHVTFGLMSSPKFSDRHGFFGRLPPSRAFARATLAEFRAAKGGRRDRHGPPFGREKQNRRRQGRRRSQAGEEEEA